MALLGLPPPPAFLETPGDPSMTFSSWIRMFDNYILALGQDDIPDKRKRALLIHCLGTEGQRIFYTLEVENDTYAAALAALKSFFVPKINVVAERNKFRQRSQRPGESVVQFVAALRGLLVHCDVGTLADDMIRDQLVEKTCNSRIRERLLLETDLTLQKAITIAGQMESAATEAKAMTCPGDVVVKAVHARSYVSTKPRRSSQFEVTQKQTASNFHRTAQNKTCYRCGSLSHLANYPKCPAKQVTFRLVTYMKRRIPVLGCIILSVTCSAHCTQVDFYIVEKGTPLLGMDLFTALQLEIRDGCVMPSAGWTAAVDFTDACGVAEGFVHKVKLRSDVPPLQQKLRRLPFAVRDSVSQELKRLEKEGIIEKVDSSEWVSPTVVIQKKSGGIRLCVDLREPNKAVVIDSHPLPHIEEVFTELRGSAVFSTIDLQNAYHQVTLHEDSRDLTAFITHDGLFRFTRVPYGLASAPSAFQRMMSQILDGLDGVQCYLDDIIIHADTPETHERRLCAVLHRLQDRGLKINREKCSFRKTELPFLGHVISATGLHPDPEHVVAVTQAPPPQDAHALRSFLGLTGWYAKFIPNYATLVEPLRAVLRKSTGFCWTDEANEKFSRVKQIISTSHALALFDPSCPTTVTTDASNYGLGAVLTQWHGDTELTVAFASRTLSECERKYSATEKEALACVWATEKWRTYLWGRHFTLQTDHNPLTTLLSTKGLGRAGMRIARCLLCFNYTIVYKPGTENVTADCLSRLPLPCMKEEQEQEPEMVAVVSPGFAAVTAEELQHAVDQCPVLHQVKAYITKGWPRTAKGMDSALTPFYRLRYELAVQEGYVIRGTHRVVVPATLQPKFIQLAHDTHQGIVRTRQRLRDLYWWPGMNLQVENAIKTCTTCLQHDKTAITHTAPLHPVPIPTAAWEKVAIDIVGPFHHAVHDCRYAVTLIDYYSKWPEVAFASEVTSATVITFLSVVFSREGNPREVVSDNGPQFISSEFESFLAMRDIKHCRSAVYFPQANGEIERFNRVFKDSLQTATIEGKPWKPFVTEFLHTYRATPHTITTCSPAELLHGHAMHTKLHVRDLPAVAPPKSAKTWKLTVQRKQQKAKEYADKRRAATAPGIQVDSFVRIRKPGIVSKGQSKFSLPYKVIAKRGPATYLLSDGKVWNAAHLAPTSLPYAVPSTLTVPEDTYVPHEVHTPCAVPSEHSATNHLHRVRRAPFWAKDYVPS
ncbi:hypothetical protein SRHO_G00020150 [Serrasalmus rhombeus]